ncbi:hypothetical protein A2U01_0090463, partial [Trifolium medium]|nr:hypothetical protein [Trifolium medium]
MSKERPEADEEA